MRWCLVALVAFCVSLPTSGRADSGLNVGLFLDTADITSEENESLLNFQADVEEDRYNVGVSLRMGSFVFGFESKNNNNSGGYDGANLAGGGPAGLSSDTSVLSDRSYRVLMGMVLPNQSVIYGFNGLTNRKSRRDMSYFGEEIFSRTTYEKTGRCVSDGNGGLKAEVLPTTINAMVTTTGQDTSVGTNLGFVLGAGFEQHILGGALRFEYSMTRFNAFEQALSLNRSGGFKGTPASGSSFQNVQWDQAFEHLVEMRWQTSF